MLVLTREINEELVVTLPDGRQMTIAVMDVRGPKVRLGIAADKDITINRREVQDAIERSRR